MRVDTSVWTPSWVLVALGQVVERFTSLYDHLMTLSLTQYIFHRYSLGRRSSACAAIPPQEHWYGWRLQRAWRARIGVEERGEGWQQ